MRTSSRCRRFRHLPAPGSGRADGGGRRGARGGGAVGGARCALWRLRAAERHRLARLRGPARPGLPALSSPPGAVGGGGGWTCGLGGLSGVLGSGRRVGLLAARQASRYGACAGGERLSEWYCSDWRRRSSGETAWLSAAPCKEVVAIGLCYGYSHRMGGDGLELCQGVQVGY